MEHSAGGGSFPAFPSLTQLKSHQHRRKSKAESEREIVAYASRMKSQMVSSLHQPVCPFLTISPIGHPGHTSQKMCKLSSLILAKWYPHP